MGDGWVFQNHPSKGGEGLVRLAEFAGRRGCKLAHRPASHEISRITNKISSMLTNPQPYHLLFNNCEHSVNTTVRGKASSPQLQKWLSLGVGFLLMRTRRRF